MPVHTGSDQKFRLESFPAFADILKLLFDEKPFSSILAPQPVRLGGAQVPGADPGPDGTGQPASPGSGVAAAVLPGGDGLCRRRGLAGQMEKQQVLYVEPDFSSKTARLRTPWAGGGTQLVHGLIQERHLFRNFPRKAAHPFHIPFVVSDFPANPILNPLPCPFLSPGNRLLRSHFLHCSAVKIGSSREAVKPVR